MKLMKLLHDTGIKAEKYLEDEEVSGIARESGKVVPGAIFICMKGAIKDGHDYAKEALDRGAIAIVANQSRKKDLLDLPEERVLYTEDTNAVLGVLAKNYYENPLEGIALYGVTGTNGKTTITHMLQRILTVSGEPCGLVGTLKYDNGICGKFADRTTPQADELWRLLAEMKENKLRACSIEVSSHGLALGRTAGMEFDYSIFTNLTEDHLDFHKNMEEYYQVKKKLFYRTRKMCIINQDDPYGERLLQELKQDRIPCKSYSLKENWADYYASVWKAEGSGSVIQIRRNACARATMELKLPGLFNVYNGLAAWACMSEAGIQDGFIKEALQTMKSVPGRFEAVENEKKMTVIVDYAHTPDALENVLTTAKEITKGTLICVFGCGGDRDAIKRPIMGKIAGTLAQYCIITSDNPRTEDQDKIAQAIEQGMKETKCPYEMINDRRKAIQVALNHWRAGDTIVIAGKGHETYQIIGNTKNAFDDRKVVWELLKDPS